MIRQLDDRTLISDQIVLEDIGGLAEQHGVTMLVNNRPDGEEPGQPLAANVGAAAEAAGLSYRHIPIIRGIGPADVEAMQEALHDARDGKLLAFCRSGTRSSLTLALALRQEGMPRAEVERRVAEAGFDTAPIAHLL